MSTILTDRVLRDVRDERDRQDDKWGRKFTATRRMDKWLPILMEEVGEASEELINADDPLALRAELVQVAAVAVFWIESLDEQRQSSGVVW